MDRAGPGTVAVQRRGLPGDSIGRVGQRRLPDPGRKRVSFAGRSVKENRGLLDHALTGCLPGLIVPLVAVGIVVIGSFLFIDALVGAQA
jgi:hypothetical protein